LLAYASCKIPYCYALCVCVCARARRARLCDTSATVYICTTACDSVYMHYCYAVCERENVYVCVRARHLCVCVCARATVG